MPLHVKATHTDGDEFKVELVNPQAPNGRPLSQVFVASFADLLAIKHVVEGIERGQRISQEIAGTRSKLPEVFS